MKVLVVCSTNNGLSPFVKDQVASLRDQGILIDIFGIKGKGKSGYLKNLPQLKKIIASGNYDLVHAHYGLSGLLANFQRLVPVITTYHGSDVRRRNNIKYSKIAARLSRFNILANAKLNDSLRLRTHFSIIPCGIDFKNFKPMDRDFCKRKMGLSLSKDYILFSSSFARKVKNPALAKKTVDRLENAELIELTGYSRKEVNLLINASKLVLITSHHEAGPLIAKEALACNVPIVSTDVGDVKEVIKNVEGSYIVGGSLKYLVKTCRSILDKDETYDSRKHVHNYQLPIIANQIKQVYSNLVIHC